MVAFGPVPSRRLGHSLGVNNIPPKLCTYSCIYCQVGRTAKIEIQRRPFYQPEAVFEGVAEQVKRARARGEAIDCLTFVPDGEPTLDFNLGREIRLLRTLDLKIAVITNASLIWRPDVREDLAEADWVSLKVDSTREEVWRRIHRPHGGLHLAWILEGMLQFAKSYEGELATETILVRGINDDDGQLLEIAEFLALLWPSKAYLSIPTRPPAERWVRSPEESVINHAFQIIAKRIEHLEYLIGYEGNDFACTGDPGEDLLGITSVHPMREDAVRDFLLRSKTDWSLIQRLKDQGQIGEVQYEGKRFFMRRLPSVMERSELS